MYQRNMVVARSFGLSIVQSGNIRNRANPRYCGQTASIDYLGANFPWTVVRRGSVDKRGRSPRPLILHCRSLKDKTSLGCRCLGTILWARRRGRSPIFTVSKRFMPGLRRRRAGCRPRQ